MATLKIYDSEELITEFNIMEMQESEQYKEKYIDGDIQIDFRFAKPENGNYLFNRPNYIHRDLDLYIPVFGLINPTYIDKHKIKKINFKKISEILHKKFYEENRDIKVITTHNNIEIDSFMLVDIWYQFQIMNDVIVDSIYLFLKQIYKDGE